MPKLDPYDLQRFVDAQTANYADAVAELARGQKRTHWIWYVFPQLAGLGRSAIAQRYGIKSLDEAKAYAAHPILGPRLIECTGLMLAVRDRSATQILGAPDDMKFHSSMTLFAIAAPEVSQFKTALDSYFGGEADAGTLRLLGP
jgi:uncharacterized protein (DUF1810 family)